MPGSKPIALLIDDDPEIRAFIRAVLTPMDFFCEEFDGFSALRDRMEVNDADVIFLDLSLGEDDGVEVLRWLADLRCPAGIALVSSFDERLLATALKVGQSYGLSMLSCLRKPVKPADLRDMLANRPRPQRAIAREELALGIEARELVLFYQPKIEVATGAVSSAEALVRWNNGRRGLIFPGSFIPLAETSGLMSTMTDIVLDQALFDRAAWGALGFSPAVAVNLSASALVDLDLPNRVGASLHKHGVPASALILEVTEASAMRDTRSSMDVLTRLRIKGAGVSIDDFGTGYSSLAELHRLPFTELKIDRSFTTEIHRDKDSRIIVDAIIRMAHAMGLRVVAEGVETAEQLRILADMECDVAQGYHFCRAVPYDKFIAFLESREPAFADRVTSP
ncbi:diguanylate phosphodiesterase [Rhodospirillum rubrum]|uniref:GGDEF/EAL domain-containing response regulator n=1 Tax=Rhodospirillum rubrum TaxID=1085 RepID=UPI001903FD0F|nr:EAL domain-containing response regulator [Rhodospirillum rubrum]MBK1663092.1 diguanylate phosphodiesterase [Rhodospirillum rubrum]MBK1675753.1 diguanylate phosphodiesterase [Rhodospirillum rubrum]